MCLCYPTADYSIKPFETLLRTNLMIYEDEYPNLKFEMTSCYYKYMFLILSFQSGLVGLLLARVANTVFLTGMCLLLFEYIQLL